MAYYADGSWGNNGNQAPFASPSAQGAAPVNRNAFQANDLFGGGSTYYDTAGGGQAGYERLVSGMTGQNGADSGGRFGNWLRSRFNTVNNQYGAAQGQDPSLKWTDYLTNQQNNLQQQYIGQNPYDKGEQGTRAVKWL